MKKIKLIILTILVSALVSCSHPYSEFKEGYYVGCYQSDNFGRITSFAFFQETIKGKTVERRYEIPDSLYWKLYHTNWGVYVKK
jgi:hypothetical protein